MIVASIIVALVIAILLSVVGVGFLIIGSLSRAVTGYGKTVLATGRVFLWSGLGMLAFLILTMMFDVAGIYSY